MLKSKTHHNKDYIILTSVLAVAALAHICALFINQPFDTDVQCFKAWSEMLFQNGTANFYSLDAFTDYPPGYMYVLYIVGAIRSMFNLPYDSAGFDLLIKIPAMLCDIVTSAVIFVIARKKISLKYAAVLSLCYALNPAVIINSSVWGQVDAVHTLALIGAIYFLTVKKYYIASAIFAIAVLIKPQALIFTPVFLLAIILMHNSKEKPWQTALKSAKYILFGSAVFIIGAAGFTKGFDFTPIISQYFTTLSSSPYASINAYNFYAMIGANWKELSITFFGIQFSVWGTIAILSIVAYITFIFVKNKCRCSFLIGASLCILMFVFSVKMRERYIFPALALLMLAYIQSWDKRILFLFAGFSITTYINCADILRVFANNQNYSLINNSMQVVSMANVALAVYLLFILWNYDASAVKHVSKKPVAVTTCKIQRSDVLWLALIMSVYSVIAFVNLGDTKSAETACAVKPGDRIELDFGKEVQIDEIKLMNGYKENISLRLWTSNKGAWNEPIELTAYSPFAWHEFKQTEPLSARYITIEPLIKEFELREIAFCFEDEVIVLQAFDLSFASLFDESKIVPSEPTYLNSTYFDEIYHARCGYELLHGQSVMHSDQIYETTHPPLGKDIIAAGIALFGMTPFGWRFMGALSGVLMLAVLYIFAKRISKSTFFAAIAASLFAFDFMHFAQTRIATIDSFTVLFILTAYFFMYEFYAMPQQAPFKKSLQKLLLCGVFTGFAIATKWQGVYAVAGLAALFFIALLNRCKFFSRNFIKTCAWCILFFIAIPAGIYLLSYIPFVKANGINTAQGAIAAIIQNQFDMFNYHSSINAQHPYQSDFWQWPLNIRPIFMYAQSAENGMKSGISSFGNPAVWLAGLGALIWTIYHFVKTRASNALFLIIAFASQYLPWVFISRCTFIYHYFPSVPFLILLIVFMLCSAKENTRNKAVALTCVSALLFVMFYPVISGAPVSYGYVENFLKWLPTWQFII